MRFGVSRRTKLMKFLWNFWESTTGTQEIGNKIWIWICVNSTSRYSGNFKFIVMSGLSQYHVVSKNSWCISIFLYLLKRHVWFIMPNHWENSLSPRSTFPADRGISLVSVLSRFFRGILPVRGVRCENTKRRNVQLLQCNLNWNWCPITKQTAIDSQNSMNWSHSFGILAVSVHIHGTELSCVGAI